MRKPGHGPRFVPRFAPTTETWPERAACNGDASPDDWWPGDARIVKDEPPTRAERLCFECEVANECFVFALANNEQDGMWAGVRFARIRKGDIVKLRLRQRARFLTRLGAVAEAEKTARARGDAWNERQAQRAADDLVKAARTAAKDAWLLEHASDPHERAANV